MNTVFLLSALLAGVLVPLLQPLPLTAPVAILEWHGSQLKGTPSQLTCVRMVAGRVTRP